MRAGVSEGAVWNPEDFLKEVKSLVAFEDIAYGYTASAKVTMMKGVPTQLS